MGFSEVNSLDSDITIILGGTNRKTGKANATQIEGYFLGTREIGPNKFNKSKTDCLHFFQTPDGNVGVWGKSDMDKKLKAVVPGTMTRVTFTGERDVGKGNPMLCYKIEVDTDNTIDVAALTPVNQATDDGDYDAEPDAEEVPVDEVKPARAAAPKTAAPLPNAAKVKSLLGNRRTA
jgi:hypothetical protein